MVTQHFSRRFLIAVIASAGVALCCVPCRAVTTLFLDTFDRPDNADIDAVTTGITNNTGTTFGASAVYSQPWIDPTNNPTEGTANNGGAERILSNQLQLAVGAGTSNAFVNHNFVNSQILADGGFKVSVDIGAYANTTNGFGGAFAIGMTLAEAQMGHDANDGQPAPPATTPIAKFTNAFQDTAFTTGTVLSDFYLGLRGNSTLAWGSGTAAPTVVSVGTKTGTISATFGVTSFAAGAPVTYEVFYNNVSKGTGTFIWTDANSNYIGLDARDASQVNMDNFLVQTTVPPPKPTLLVNRDTGNITIQNLTSSGLSITAYSIITAQGGFNQASWSKIQAQGIDTNDTWYTFTGPSSTTDLAEGTLGEYTIPASGQINLGNAWRRSPFEDLGFELRNSAGDDVPVLVSYTGNGGSAFRVGDFSLSGGLDAADWVILRNHLTSNVSALSQIDRYFAGDLNGDGFVNELDFRQFKVLYTAGNGAGSFEAMLASVPEPASMILCLGCVGLLVMRMPRRHGVARACLFATLVTCSLSANRVHALDLFVDSFNRPDNVNIDAVTTGVTGTIGSTLPADGVYLTPWVDPAAETGIIDADQTNGGGHDITGNQLRLAVGAGTSNAYVNHNFTDAAITTAKGFRVTMDVTGYTNTTNAYGGAIAVGMSSGNAAMSNDAFEGAPSGVKMTNAFGGVAGTPAGSFWFGLRGDNSLVWGIGNQSLGTVTGLPAKTGTISALFAVNDFNTGSTVAYEVFYNGVSQGFGGFRWNAANANFIGVDARDPTAVSFDNFKIESVTGVTPQTLRLQVNTSSGAASVVGGGSNNSLDYYEIDSSGGGLVAGNFNGIRGDSGLPAGNGTGNGWELGGANSSSSLTEAYLTGQSTIAAGAAAIPLGSIYNTTTNSHDLQFTYFTNDGVSHLGFVEYLASSLPDFNGNGVVDAADYVVWRKNNGLTGGATLAQGDANGDGSVNATDYALWRASFGMSAGSGAGSLAGGNVPEPPAMLLLLIAASTTVAATTRRRKIVDLN